MFNSDPLNDINEKHKVRTPRPKWQVYLIIAAVVISIAFTTITTLVVGKVVIGEIIGQLYPSVDRQGGILQKEFPMRWSRDKEYSAKNIKLLWGIFQFPVGDAKLRYYFILELENGEKLRTEVTKEQYDRVGFFDGLCVEFIKGRLSGNYYIINIYPAKKNNLLARFWHIIKN